MKQLPILILLMLAVFGGCRDKMIVRDTLVNHSWIIYPLAFAMIIVFILIIRFIARLIDKFQR